MEHNVLKELHVRKQKLIGFIKEACSCGWITAKEQTEIIGKIESDILTIGVIGQMKCGKSTFLNAFVFEDDILPSATTPMTASLTVITHGEKKMVEVEFYTEEEWAEICRTASKDLNENSLLENSKIKAAKELVAKSIGLGNSINSFLGKTQEDTFENLIHYVGASGKYVSITKSVKILYPAEYLKGVEIVDTPGFNDPIVSREERTKEFLKRADVVVMLIYAGRPFDATDNEILFKYVAQCGMGKVLIGINKYDIPYEDGEFETDIVAHIKSQIEETAQKGERVLKNLLEETDPIALSAEMALLSLLPMAKINASKEHTAHFKRYCDVFEMSSQTQFRERSHIDNLIGQIRNVIEREKFDILLKKPYNRIVAIAKNLESSISNELSLCKDKITSLSIPDDELLEKENNINRLHRRLSRKVELLGEDISETINLEFRRGKQDLEDCVDSACSEMHREVDSWGRFASSCKLEEKLARIIDKLNNRDLPRMLSKLSNGVKSKVLDASRDWITQCEELLLQYPELLSDFDIKDFTQSVKNRIEVEIEYSDSFELVFDFDALGHMIFHSWAKTDYHKAIRQMQNGFDAEYLLFPIHGAKDSIIDVAKRSFIDEFIEPIQSQIEEIVNNKEDKEKMLKEALVSEKDLTGRLEMVKDQITKLMSNYDPY